MKQTRFYRHSGGPSAVSYWVSRAKPTVGNITYSISLKRAGTAHLETLVKEELFKENDSYHTPRTIFLENGDELYAEVSVNHLWFRVSGPG